MDARMSFLVQVNESDESFAALCRRYGISRKTGYKWVERYEQQGPAGLKDRPPLASHHPDRVPEALVDILVATRKEHPFWGPKKLRAWLLEHRPEHPWPVLPRPVIDGRSIRLGDGIPSAGAKSRPPRGWSEGQVVASVVGEGARAPVSVDGGEQVVGAAEDVEGSAGLVVVAHSDVVQLGPGGCESDGGDLEGAFEQSKGAELGGGEELLGGDAGHARSASACRTRATMSRSTSLRFLRAASRKASVATRSTSRRPPPAASWSNATASGE